MLRHSLAVAAIDARILWRDPSPVVVMTVIPLVFVPFFIPGARAQLADAGYPSAAGVEYAVPGLAVLFALLCVQQVVTAFFRDDQWGTGERLRTSPARSVDLLLGKSLTAFGAQLLQFVAVLLGGALIFGYRPTGSVVGMTLVLVAFSSAMIGFGLLLASASRSLELSLVIGNVLAMLMAGVGGAFGPVESLPAWMQSIAPASPAYWALQAMRSLTLDRAGVLDVLGPTLALFGFTTGFGLLAAALLAVRRRKGIS
ncbi:ABC transporter permease [Microbacterium maritypicum]|uniref:ABC transporter permease n=1 Tax=Microbacterium maritypicum TaxID=33918 RepID=UPI001B31EED8|nr:ABC transporter permease [Microbacterium liquefaciens]MBP5803706.1 ABC transporter permease [Microbacterium liquefaciens]